VWKDRLPTIAAERVRLRWLVRNDVDALYDVFSDTDVMRYWSSPPLQDREGAGRLLEQIQDHFHRRDLFQWGVTLHDDDRVIGTCTLCRLDLISKRAEVGFALGRVYWGHGYMSEALEALFGLAFDELQLRRIEADVDPRNGASIRLLERLGFQREGHLRERWLVNGEVQDALFYGLLRREWMRRGAVTLHRPPD
jgi:RimJ/RimL family protein N-acetyltransferase